MAEQRRIILHRGKDKPIRNKHHWIFSGAIKSASKFSDGEILPVYDFHSQFLGKAYFSNNTSIAGRMLTFDHTEVIEQLTKNISDAYKFRKSIISSDTNSYRLINGEADRIPGLIVDVYNDIAVIQSSTAGIDYLIEEITAIIESITDIQFFYQKSDMGARAQSGLQTLVGFIGEGRNPEVEILENGIKYKIDLENSHKTGFYLDQRNMRTFVRGISKNKRVLNCFSYTGGFSLSAAVGGASRVDSVDISGPAIEQTKLNFELNGLETSPHKFIADDVFKYLRDQESLDYDIVVLDPPAFAKKKGDIHSASRGYRDINRLAIEKMPKGSILITCSCSYHIDQELFQKLVFQAASDTDKNVRIIQRHHMAEDHPINIFHSEADYLKSLVLYLS